MLIIFFNSFLNYVFFFTKQQQHENMMVFENLNKKYCRLSSQQSWIQFFILMFVHSLVHLSCNYLVDFHHKQTYWIYLHSVMCAREDDDDDEYISTFSHNFNDHKSCMYCVAYYIRNMARYILRECDSVIIYLISKTYNIYFFSITFSCLYDWWEIEFFKDFFFSYSVYFIYFLL